MSREAISPMPRNARVDEHIYAGLSRAELHRAALERIDHYSQTPPDPDLASTWAMLKSAWEWVAERHAPNQYNHVQTKPAGTVQATYKHTGKMRPRQVRDAEDVAP